MVKSHCMELKEMISFGKKNIKILVASIILMGAIGALAYYFLPVKHYATGSLFIRRSIYPYSEGHFTYEGYYGQQAAMSYANSVIGLIESEDIRAQTLTALEIPVNEETLRKYERKIRTVKSGPQLIGLVVKENGPQEAEKLWQAVADSTINTMNGISRVNDPFVGVVKISENPIIREGYRNPVICVLVGMGFGLVLAVSYLALFNYFKSNKKK